MMKLFFTIILFVPILSCAYGQSFKQVKIYLNEKINVQELNKAGIDIDHATYTKDNAIVAFVSGREYEMLKYSGYQHEVLIDDWFSYYDQLPKLTENERENIIAESKMNYNVDGFGFGSMGGFYTYAEIGANLDSMFMQYPNLITQKVSIGTSHNGNNIWAVKISDNPNIAENEASVGMDALIHAREPQSMATLMYFMWYLLENYGTNPEVTYLVNNREIYCVPCFNPDGYEYNRQTNPNGGGLWRKNRRNNGSSYGVDLNRNYPYKWGYDNSGSSPTPSSDTYRGPSPGSEPETQAIMNYILPKTMKAHFNMHSGASAYLYPWGYINQACPDFLLYEEYCQDMVAYNGYEYGTGAQVLGYVSNGSARDWLYCDSSKSSIIGYTYEIGPFWPTQSQIIPIAQLNVRPLLYHSWISGEYIKLKSTSYNVNYFNPGDYVEMNADFRNKGLGNGNNITVTLTALTPNASVVNGNVNFPSVASRTEVSTPVPFSFNVSSSAMAEEELKLLLTISSGGTVMNSDTIKLFIGTPSFILNDTTNVITNYWTPSGTWGATTSSYHTAPNSYTDSPAGNYGNNVNATLTLKNALNLSSFQNPMLSFWTKYDLEAGWDYGQVEVSTNNGSTWTPLQGLYTVPGSGSFQPNGQPLYNGTRATWVREEMSLTGFNTNQVKVRFEIRTDGNTVRDGWYVDDIGVFIYTIVPVELSSFTADVVNEDVIIRWTTASELNNLGFEIERRVEAGNWITAGNVQGSGTSTDIHSYSFTDENPGFGDIFYRLKQIDFDGTTRLYGPLHINISGVSEYELLQNYPNPFNPSTKIRYSVAGSANAGVSSNVTIKLYDVLGNEVKTLVNENKQPGKYVIEFDAAELASGIYYYTMKTGDFVQSCKMMILK